MLYSIIIIFLCCIMIANRDAACMHAGMHAYNSTRPNAQIHAYTHPSACKNT